MKVMKSKVFSILLVLCMIMVMTPTMAFGSTTCDVCEEGDYCIDSASDLATYFDEANVSYDSEQNQYKVTLASDVVARVHLKISDGINLVIDTNGHNLAGTPTATGSKEALCIENYCNQNVSLTGSGTLSSSATHTIFVGVNGTLNVNGVTIINRAEDGKTIKALGGTTTYTVSYSTVTFDATDGIGSMVVTRPNGDYTLPACDFTAPADKVFAGWAESADGAVISGTYNLSADDTLYAIWTDDSALTGTVTITGDAKFGSTLTANVADSNNTGDLSYEWYRGGVQITSADGSDTYTLVENDLNEKIKVVVTSSVQTGSIESAQTEVVVKGDNLNVPTGLVGVAPTSAGGSDGKITGTTTAMEWSSNADFSSSETCGDSVTNVRYSGTYYVRYRQTSTYFAGSNYATVVVPDYGEQATGYDIWVGGVRVTSDNLVIDTADNAGITAGSATYDSAANTLTLNGFTYSGAGYPDTGSNGAIYTTEDLKINLVGTNNITNISTGGSWNCGIYVPTGHLTITGSGDLTVTGGGGYTSHGISVGRSLTFDGTGTVNAIAAAAQGTSGIYASAGTTVNSGTVNAQAAAASDGDSRGIEKSLTVNGGTVTAQGHSVALDTVPTLVQGITAQVSTEYAGTTAVDYAGEVSGYKWFRTAGQPTTYSVSFVPGEGSGTMEAASGIRSGAEYTLPSCTFTAPSGMQFKAWQVGVVEKAVGAKITVSADTTVTAIWEAIPVSTYTVSFNANGGSGSITSVSGLTSGAEYTLPECGFTAPAGKVFKAWDVNGAEKAPGDKITVSADTTVKAIWKNRPVVIPAVIPDPLAADRAEANEAISTEAAKDADQYAGIADQIKAVADKAAAEIKAAKTAEAIQAAEDEAKTEIQQIKLAYDVDQTQLVARSKFTQLKNGKMAVLVTWYDAAGREVDFEGYEVYRSTERYKGYGSEPFFEAAREKYYNTAIEEGNTYYYKVRGYVTVDGERLYTEYSLKAWRTVK